MNKKLLLIILALTCYSKIFACLNGESIVLKDGTFLYQDTQWPVPHGHDFYFNDFENGITRLDSLYKATKDLDYLSDKGLLLILLKEYDQAIKIYLDIENLQAGRYSTASNLGTAYELIGQNESALKWIKKAVEIDPTSHKNSEWLHVKILETKIKGSSFITTDFLLNTNFGTEIMPTSSLNDDEISKLSKALYYQLNERVSFVKPKEKIVAQLLFDLGNLEFLLLHYGNAKLNYKEAEKYGYSGKLIEHRFKESTRLYKLSDTISYREVHRPAKPNYFMLGLGGFAVFTLIFIFIYIYKERLKS
jgi:hypothetical protein